MKKLYFGTDEPSELSGVVSRASQSRRQPMRLEAGEIRRIVVSCLYLIIVGAVAWSAYSFIFARVCDHAAIVSAEPGASKVQLCDFVRFYQAGSLASSPETRFAVYDSASQQKWLLQFTSPATPDRAYFLEYVPFIFPAMMPLACLQANDAYVVWLGLSVLALCGGLWLLARMSQYPQQAMIIFVSVLASVPCWNTLLVGQIACFLVCIVACYLYAVRNQKNLLAGCMLALSTIKPHYAAFAMIPCLVLQRWKVLIFAALFEVLLLSVAAITIGWQNVIFYPSILWSHETNHQFSDGSRIKQICIRGLLTNFMPENLALIVSLVFWMGGIVCTAMVWYRLGQRLKARTAASVRSELLLSRCWFWSFSFTLLSALCLSPHTYLYDWVLLFLLLPFAPPYLSLHGLRRRPVADLSHNLLGTLWFAALCSYSLISWIGFIAGVMTGVANAPQIALGSLHLLLYLGCIFLLKQNLGSTNFTVEAYRKMC